jgi:hypothetical protein
MRKRDILLRLTIALALAAILLPLAAVLLIPAALLLIPALAVVVVAALVVLLVRAARSQQTCAGGPLPSSLGSYADPLSGAASRTKLPFTPLVERDAS